jgi:hypothetical protein
MEDHSLRVIVKNNPLGKPLLNSREATTIEIRDRDGELACLVALMPKSPVFVVTKDSDQDFVNFAKSLGVKLTEKFD